MAVIISDMEHIPKSCFDCDFHNYHFCNMTGNCIEQNIDDGTRAEDCPLKEVPKGKWILEKAIVRCSNCGKGYKEAFGKPSAVTFNYCPNCGSLMVEEQGETE